MPNVRTVLLPTDFSRTARSALRVAARMAYRLDAHLTVVHIVRGRSENDRIEPRMPLVADVDALMHDSVRNALDYLPADAADRLAVQYRVVPSISAADGILRMAEEADADAIVMGTHGRRGVRRFILGSVAARVLHEAMCDVLVVPRLADARLNGRLLVPVDLFGRSPDVLKGAVRLAERLQTGVDLLYVLDTSKLLGPTLEPFMPEKMVSLQDVARARLRELTQHLDGEPDIRPHVVEGHPAREIVEFADVQESSLVVMASSGMTPEERALLERESTEEQGDRRWMLGSITERVATHATVPVWVWKRFANRHLVPRDDVHHLELTAS